MKNWLLLLLTLALFGLISMWIGWDIGHYHYKQKPIEFVTILGQYTAYKDSIHLENEGIEKLSNLGYQNRESAITAVTYRDLEIWLCLPDSVKNDTLHISAECLLCNGPTIQIYKTINWINTGSSLIPDRVLIGWVELIDNKWTFKSK